jgi:hypothetical protein
MLKLNLFSALIVGLCYAAVAVAVLSLFATPLWYAWRHSIEQSQTDVLHAEAQIIKNLLVDRALMPRPLQSKRAWVPNWQSRGNSFF